MLGRAPNLTLSLARRLLVLSSIAPALTSVPRRAAARAAAEAYTAAAANRVSAPCPCEDVALCSPVSGAPARAQEIFGFVGGDGSTLDWSRTTTVAWSTDDEILCAAHKAGARIVLAAPGPDKVFGANETVRKQWVASAVRAVVNAHADGMVFDWESPTTSSSPSMRAYIEIIGETRTALRAVSASYQVTVCVAWSPDDIDGRDYDVVGLAAHSDLLYVMDYDTRSQIYDDCVAGANAPYFGMVHGLTRYVDVGVPKSQLVLGVPWYGYRYECLPATPPHARLCPIRPVPFRGVNCSDAAGSEVGYAAILQHARRSTTGRQWDSNQGAPYFNTVEPTADGTTATVQYWYDDAQSLRAKYAYARQQGIRGVGPFTYTEVGDHAPDMWSALDTFLHGPPPPPPTVAQLR